MRLQQQFDTVTKQVKLRLHEPDDDATLLKLPCSFEKFPCFPDQAYGEDLRRCVHLILHWFLSWRLQ